MRPLLVIIKLLTALYDGPAVYTQTVEVTAYVPYSDDPRNGTFCWGLDVADCPYKIGTCACGWDYPIGTLFTMPAWAVEKGIPRVLRCNSRGGIVVGVDVALIYGVQPDREAEGVARAWGRRWVEVTVELPAYTPLPPPVPYRVRGRGQTWRAMDGKIERMEAQDVVRADYQLARREREARKVAYP